MDHQTRNMFTTNLCLKQHQIGIILIFLFALSGCTSAKIFSQHPAIDTTQPDNLVAKVYIIRPMPVKYKGIADNTIAVEYNNQKLMEINEGQYALFKLLPSSGEITTRSKTNFTNKNQPIDVSRSRLYKFTAGKTYFINLTRLNEEFRGIFYDPEPINLPQAQRLAQNLTPLGSAKKEPINAIATIGSTIDASPLEPAFPENLYPGTPYVIQKNPTFEPKPAEGKNEMTFDTPPEEPKSIQTEE